MSFGRLLIGALLIGVGGLLLASHLGYLPPGVMPWFLQFWPALLILFGLTFLANAMKSPLLGWLAVVLALAAMGFGGWWLAHNQAAAGTTQRSYHSLTKPLVQTVTVNTTTLGGRITLASIPVGGSEPTNRAARDRANSLQVAISGVSENSARHVWNAAGRAGEFIWPERTLIPHTAPMGADIALTLPERTPVRLITESILSGAEFDLARLRPETCDLRIVSGAARVRVGAAAPRQIRVHGVLGAVEIDLPASGPVRVEFLSPLTARSLPEDFLEHVGGRGAAKIWISEGKGTPLLVQVDGTLLYVKIKRAPERAGG